MIKKSKKEKTEKRLFHIFTTMLVILLLPELELPSSPISQRNIPVRVILNVSHVPNLPKFEILFSTLYPPPLTRRPSNRGALFYKFS